MMRSLFIAKTGMDAQQTSLDVTSNNLANASTNGFKRSRAIFEDLLYQTSREPGAQVGENGTTPTGLQVGTGVRTAATVRSHQQGNLQETRNPLDMALNGEGFFQIQHPDGRIAYTRSGNFEVNADGVVVDQNGYPMVGDITVPREADNVTITQQGEVSVRLAGDSENTVIGQIEIATFINPTGLRAEGQNLFFETEGSGDPVILQPGEEGAGSVFQGFVETSNVNVVEELVSMIQTQRAYELNSRVISTSDEMLQRATQL